MRVSSEYPTRHGDPIYPDRKYPPPTFGQCTPNIAHTNMRKPVYAYLIIAGCFLFRTNINRKLITIPTAPMDCAVEIFPK